MSLEVDDVVGSELADVLDELERGAAATVAVSKVTEEHLRILAPSLIATSCWKKLSLTRGRLDSSHIDELARIMMFTAARVQVLE